MNLYDLQYKSIEGKDVSLSEYKGKVLLIVNTASACGFTPQYKGLQELQDKYAAKGFTVLGFPCNQFGAQESGTESEIASFCEARFGVTFPLSKKVDVNGKDASPVFKLLTGELPGLFGFLGLGQIKWNFTKFLVGRDGAPIQRYAPSVEPSAIAADIEKALG